MDDVRLKIAGTGSYLPKDKLTNEELSELILFKRGINGEYLDEGKKFSEEDMYQRTGIESRAIARDYETSSYMGYHAAIEAIDDSKIDPRSLTGIILATVTERPIPNGASKIQKAIGEHYKIRHENCLSFDINAACAGSVVAMGIADSMVRRRNGNYLVIGAEDIAKITDKDDRNRILFGAGAGAVVLTPTTSEKGIRGWDGNCDPYDDNDRLITSDERYKLRMPEGQPVMKKAIRYMVKSSKQSKESAGWKNADIYIPHQANGRISDGVELRVKREGSVVYRNIKNTGNSSAATCLLALDKARKEKFVKEGDKVIIVSFGSGLVTSSVAIQM